MYIFFSFSLFCFLPTPPTTEPTIMGVVSWGWEGKELEADGAEEVADFVLVVVELEEEVLDRVVVVDEGLALEEATVVVVDGGNTMLLEAELEGARVDRVVVVGADEDGGGGGGATVVVVVVVVEDGATVGTITGGVVEAGVFDGSFDVLDISSGSDWQSTVHNNNNSACKNISNNFEDNCNRMDLKKRKE